MVTTNNKLNFLLILIGVCLLGYSGFKFYDWYSSTQGTSPPPQAEQVVRFSQNKPDEKDVDKNTAYNVPADQPKKIIIPTIGAEGFIQQVGKDQNNEVGTPTNVNFAGWYVHSVKPGDKGLSIIDGHISSRYSQSTIFKHLGELQNGAIFQVQFGDDSTKSFEVVEQRELAQADAAEFLFSQNQDIDNQLNLITCGGNFDKSSRQYNHRVIIVSKLVDNI